ncbi:MAG: hypothetical protein L0Z62_15160, partial [Gemmataceae bacterium]|nr:hypothetical protein [Gemmataceae bacterium]
VHLKPERVFICTYMTIRIITIGLYGVKTPIRPFISHLRSAGALAQGARTLNRRDCTISNPRSRSQV